MKKKYYWKVVYPKTFSGETYYFSATTVGKYKLEYKIGHKTLPKIGQIFVFRTRKDARNFNKTGLKIMKVKVENPRPLDWRAPIGDSIDNFWNCQPVPYHNCVSSPPGTYGVDSVTPISFE